MEDTSIMTNQPCTSEPNIRIPSSLANSLSNICQGLNSIDSSLSENMGLLQLVQNGDNPPKIRVSEALRRTESSIALLQGLLLSLKTTVNVLESKDNADNAPLADASTSNRRNESTTTYQANSNITRASYASMGKNSGKPSATKDTIKRRQQVRNAISKERSKIRCDERSVKFRPVLTRGIIEFGHLARAIGSLMECNRSTKDLTEQIRVDRYGTYYIQFYKGQDKFNIDKLMSLASADGTVLLDDLGKFSIFAPTSSLTKDKTPFVIHRIPMKLEED